MILGCVLISMKMAKVIFKQLTPEKFAEFIFDMKECLSEKDLHREGSCFFFDIPKNIVKEIIDSEKLTAKLKEKIISLLSDFKKIESSAIKELQYFWEEKVNYLFFREMEKIMPDCSDSEYICYVTNKMIGSYFEKENEIVVDLVKEKDMAYHSSIIAEEILHLIYWKFWRRLFDKDMALNERFDIGNADINGWSISEIIPDYLLIENKSFENLGWDTIDRSKGYSWIKKIRKKLDLLWLEKKDFGDFVIKSHSLCGFEKNKFL